MIELENSNYSLKLHPWFAYEPEIVMEDLSRQRNRASLVSKISYCAIAAISLITLSVSLFVKSPAKSFSLILFSSVIMTPALAFIASKYLSKARLLEQLISIEKATYDQFQIIRNWTDATISEFLSMHDIKPNARISNAAFILMIARYMAKAKQAMEAKRLSDKQLQAEGIHDRDLRLAMRCIGWHILENEVIPAALEAAFALHLLNHPESNYFPSDIYDLTPKSFAERMFDQIYGPDNNYLIMRSLDHHTFTLEELLQDLDPDTLRKKVLDLFRN